MVVWVVECRGFWKYAEDISFLIFTFFNYLPLINMPLEPSFLKYFL